MERRRKALIALWIQNPLVMVQAESPATLPGLVFLDDNGRTAEVGGLGRRSQTDAFIVSRPGDPERNASVWVRAIYKGYCTAYVGFLNQAYGTQAMAADLVGYDIDHLLNRARSPDGAGFIRIEAIRSEVTRPGDGWSRRRRAIHASMPTSIVFGAP